MTTGAELSDAPARGRQTALSTRLKRQIGALITAARLAPEDVQGPMTGLVSGSRYGCSAVFDLHRRLRAEGPRGIDAVGFAQATHNYPVSACAIDYGLKGPCAAIVSSCAAGMEALVCARDWLTEGRCCRVIVAAYEDLDGPAADHARLTMGPVGSVSEAMVLVCLETAAAARARRAPVLAELSGMAMLRRGAGGDDLELAARRVFGAAPGPLDACLARAGEFLGAGGLVELATVLTSGSGQSGNWLIGAFDPRTGGVVAGVRCFGQAKETAA